MVPDQSRQKKGSLLHVDRYLSFPGSDARELHKYNSRYRVIRSISSAQIVTRCFRKYSYYYFVGYHREKSLLNVCTL